MARSSIVAAILTASISTLMACGKQSKDGPLAPATTFETPTYEPSALGDSAFAWDATAPVNVAALQSVGSRLAARAAANGTLEINDDQVVQLTQIAKNACPASLPDCEVTDSAELGVSSAALVAPMDELQDGVRNQGERGTCVAFVLNGAAEIHARRDDATSAAKDFSEQNTYFIAKRATGTWNDEGLAPVQTMTELGRGIPTFVAEDLWPYNANQGSCAKYETEHPDFACSATEAQGASDGTTQEPRAATAPALTITKGHQLYASLGRVKQALHQGYPVLLGVNANIDMSIATPKNGVISWVFKEATCEGSVCGHAVLAVGYRDDATVEGGGYVVIRNSWGKEWGHKGLGFLTYTWVQNSILDAQAIVSIGATR